MKLKFLLLILLIGGIIFLIQGVGAETFVSSESGFINPFQKMEFVPQKGPYIPIMTADEIKPIVIGPLGGEKSSLQEGFNNPLPILEFFTPYKLSNYPTELPKRTGWGGIGLVIQFQGKSTDEAISIVRGINPFLSVEVLSENPVKVFVYSDDLSNFELQSRLMNNPYVVSAVEDMMT